MNDEVDTTEVTFEVTVVCDADGSLPTEEEIRDAVMDKAALTNVLVESIEVTRQ